MNSLTKQRYISTSIWSDDWFDSLTEREKLVYFYLLTNEHTNPAGVYQCTLKNVRLEIGLDREEIERIMGKFSADGKAFSYKDYIIIPKWLKHQKISERNKIFLGAVKILKSLPDDVKEFISYRRHYDWDVSEIIGKPCKGCEYPNGSSAENGIFQDEPSSKRYGSSMSHQKNSMAHTQNSENSGNDPDSDLDRDINSEFDIDTKAGKETYKTLSAHFIKRWQENADIFNCLARLKRPLDWQAFWEQNPMTLEQIDTAIDNFIDGVKTGAIERRFIPSSPDGFVINGWIARSQSRFKKHGSRRIAADTAAENDVSKYFKEV